MLLNAKVGHFNTEFMGADFLFLIFILKSPLKELFFIFCFFLFLTALAVLAPITSRPPPCKQVYGLKKGIQKRSGRVLI